MTEKRLKVARAGVGVMLMNDKGEVLLGRRHEDSEKAGSQLHGEGTWTMPGGKLDFGDGLAEAAAREVLEETGIRTGKLDLLSVNNEVRHDAHFVTIGFLCKDFQGEPQVLEPDEITEWGWFALDALPEPMFPPSMKMVNNYKNKQIFVD